MIVFIHIPKTAGTTFYEVVRENHRCLLKPKLQEDPINYLNNSVVGGNVSIRLPGGYFSASKIVNIIEEHFLNDINKINFIGGHIGYGIHDLIKENVSYISFIREPKSRLISDFKEHHKPGRLFYEDLKIKGFNFNDYLLLLKKKGLDNIMTRQLAGPIDFFFHKEVEVTMPLLNKAMINSRQVMVFEVERFDEALYVMKKKFGWKISTYKKQNVSKRGNYNLECDNILFNEVIKYDLVLYEEMKKSVLNNFDLNLFQKLQIRLINKIIK